MINNQYSIIEDPNFISIDDLERPINVIQNGWTPVFANVERTNLDGSKDVVQKVFDWIGGIGPKPQINLYVGVDGFYTDINDAVAINGSNGLATTYRYAVNTSSTIPPIITDVLNPPNWESSPQSINSGEYRWKVQGLTLISGELLGNWTTPIIDGFIDISAPESDDDVFNI